MMHNPSRIVAGIVCALLLAAASARAQYSQNIINLKAAADLYDERGVTQNKTISTDGKLSVSNTNGNVSYVYPISSTTVSGYPLEVNLLYCGSVGFTCYTRYTDANPGSGYYTGWQRFHQNRPAWILGVNGFAVNVLSSSCSFYPNPEGRAYKTAYNNIGDDSFTDADFVWTVDGYDVCNRMDYFSAMGYGSTLVDVIRLLKSDGSLLELYNANTHNGTDRNRRPDLYTGYYVQPQANAKGYAVVEYDSGYYPYYIEDKDPQPSTAPKYPWMPRRVRYYPGDGLMYVFQEWTTPFGTYDYYNDPGGLHTRSWYARPTVFYLDQIRSSGSALGQQGAPLADFTRTRHYPVLPWMLSGVRQDSTRGRALVTDFIGHHIEYGANYMTVEALGRTTRIRFDSTVVSGDPQENNAAWSPMSHYGYLSGPAMTMATFNNVDDRYKSYISYVSQIIDPEGRVTSFGYQPYVRTFVDFDFPYKGLNTSVRTTLRNLRLERVEEPGAWYRLYYRRACGLNVADDFPASVSGTDSLAVVRNDGSQYNMCAHNNVAGAVRKYFGDQLLTTSTYNFEYASANSSAIASSRIRVKDEVTNLTRMSLFEFRRYQLPRISLRIPAPVFTGLWRSTDSAGDQTVQTVTEYSTRPDSLTGNPPYNVSRLGTPYLVLETSRSVSVNNRLKSKSLYDYTIDTVSKFTAGDPDRNQALTGLFARDAFRKIMRTLNPADQTTLLIDTTDYLHLPLRDTVVYRYDTVMLKFSMLARYFQLHDSTPPDPDIAGKQWEQVMYHPKIYRFRIDTISGPVIANPVFGLVQGNRVCSAGGQVLSGRINRYDQATLSASRGNLLYDTLLGKNGVRLPVTSYDYSGFYGHNLPTQTGNANGAVSGVAYDYAMLPEYRNADGTVRTPHGNVMDDQDVLRTQDVEGGQHFGLSHEFPLAGQNIVRKYTPQGTLDTARLTTLYHRTYYGLADQIVDPNGWLTEYDYDRNGRLKQAWLPFDFQSGDSVYARDYPNTVQEFTAIGSTGWTGVYGDTVFCDGAPHSWYGRPAAVPYTDYGKLYATRPAFTRPACGNCAQAGKGGAQVQRNCNANIVFDSLSPAIGCLRFPLTFPQASYGRLVQVDSARLLLQVSSVIGQCVHLQVELPQFGYSQTFVLNCWAFNGDTASNRNYLLQVDLDTLSGELKGMASGQFVDVRLKVNTVGARVDFTSGASAEDSRPRLVLYGTVHKVNRYEDHTLSFVHDDAARRSVVSSKVDDARHTAGSIDTAATGGTLRFGQSVHTFGADDRLTGSLYTIGNPLAPLRTDTVLRRYNGAGLGIADRDQEGDSLLTAYDAAGRPVLKVNQDGSASRTAYYTGDPSGLFGITDQDFYGFCTARVATDENGRKSAGYTDAFDRLRRQVTDSGGAGHLNLITRLDYDSLGRLLRVVNPKGDTVLYAYDAFGRTARKSHPDMGSTTYLYDKAGNLRYSQTQNQADKRRLSFTQYDDLNRVTLVGEARFDEALENQDEANLTVQASHNTGAIAAPAGAAGGTAITGPESAGQKSHARVLNAPPGATGRLTDSLDATVLHDAGTSATVTANATIWGTPQRVLPRFDAPFGLDSTRCLPQIPRGAEPFVSLPLLKHQAYSYNPVWSPVATLNDFEHAARYPHFTRTAVWYDSLPASAGAVWQGFPARQVWDSMAPSGRVRNTRGREAAVAYREHGGEPFHYVVLSYDARGRLEALLRYTDNLGFDAVYYSYNSANKIISLRVADPLRQHTTWYGYDFNGRADTVWSALGQPGSGLGIASHHCPAPQLHPNEADIAYTYTPAGHVRTMTYGPQTPQLNVLVQYAYNHRKLLDSLVAGKDGALLFRQALCYDSAGQITQQRSQHNGAPERTQGYGYDNANRLTQWNDSLAGTVKNREAYAYDKAGNRIRRTTAAGTELYAYAGSGQSGNRLASVTAPGGASLTACAYNPNGSLAVQERWSGQVGGFMGLIGTELFRYSYRELLYQYINGVEDWRYRYNASGEREQKRAYVSGDSVATAPWTYYLLGADNTQLAVWHGAEQSAGVCNTTGGSQVLMWPAEYHSHGAGGGDVITRSNGLKEYRISDHLGSTRLLLNMLGGELSRRDYAPFGVELIGAGVRIVRQNWIGKEKDFESGLGDFGVRKYDPLTGRFLSIDPMWERHQAITPYHYVMNNPMRYVDPSGMDSAQRRAALEVANEYLANRAGTHYKMGAKGGPGHNTDCSGLVSNCIKAGGETDPVGHHRGTGVQQLEQGSRPTTLQNIKPGNIVTFRTGGWGFHAGIISQVIRDKNGRVTGFVMIHSSGKNDGPGTNRITPGGKGYLEKNIHGYYVWDTRPDTPPPANQNTNTAR